MKDHYVYRAYVVTCIVNRKIYVGMTRRKVCIRWREHISSAHLRSRWRSELGKAIAKHGESKFAITEVARSRSKQNIFEVERALILRLRSLVPNGYNGRVDGVGSVHPWYNGKYRRRDKISVRKHSRKVLVDARPIGWISVIIRYKRMAAGLTQVQLAKRSKVIREKLSNIEQGKLMPTVSILQRIALGLGTTLQTIIFMAEQIAARS